MKARVCSGGGDLPSETDRLRLHAIGYERRDRTGELEEKLRELQVRLIRAAGRVEHPGSQNYIMVL